MKVQHPLIKPFEINVNEDQPLKELVNRVIYYMDGENFVLASSKNAEVILYQSFCHNFINQNIKIGDICDLEEGVVICPVNLFQKGNPVELTTEFSQLMFQRSSEDLKTITIWNSSEISFTLDYTFELRKRYVKIMNLCLLMLGKIFSLSLLFSVERTKLKKMLQLSRRII